MNKKTKRKIWGKKLAIEIKVQDTKIKDRQAEKSFLSDQLKSLNNKKGILQNIIVLKPVSRKQI